MKIKSKMFSLRLYKTDRDFLQHENVHICDLQQIAPQCHYCSIDPLVDQKLCSYQIYPLNKARAFYELNHNEKLVLFYVGESEPKGVIYQKDAYLYFKPPSNCNGIVVIVAHTLDDAIKMYEGIKI